MRARPIDAACRKDSTPRNINLRFNGRIRLYFREHPFYNLFIMTTQLLLKRFFLLAALFSLALTPGCGGDDPAEDPGSGSVPEPEPDPKPDEPEEYAVKFAPSFVAPASG